MNCRICKLCKNEFELNNDNFYEERSSKNDKIIFRHYCKKCHNIKTGMRRNKKLNFNEIIKGDVKL